MIADLPRNGREVEAQQLCLGGGKKRLARDVRVVDADEAPRPLLPADDGGCPERRRRRLRGRREGDRDRLLLVPQREREGDLGRRRGPAAAGDDPESPLAAAKLLRATVTVFSAGPAKA